jgi:hypothetical protein
MPPPPRVEVMSAPHEVGFIPSMNGRVSHLSESNHDINPKVGIQFQSPLGGQTYTERLLAAGHGIEPFTVLSPLENFFCFC